MKKLSFLVVFTILTSTVECYGIRGSFQYAKKAKCLSIPTLPIRVQQHIKSCQMEVKSNVMSDVIKTVFTPHFNIEDLLRTKTPKDLSHNKNLTQLIYANHLKQELVDEDTFNYLKNQEANNYKIFHQEPYSTTYHDDSQMLYRLNPEVQHINSHDLLTPEIKYQIPSEEDDDDFVRRDKNEVVEARDELMNILSKSHNVLELDNRRDDDDKLKNNNEKASSLKKTMNRRSILTWWSYSTKNSGREENSFEVADSSEENDVKVLSNDDKWLAGCLIQCIFDKNGAIDRLGYPTLDGVVDLYTAGTHEQPFFIYTLRAVNKCLKRISSKYSVNRKKKPMKGVSCSINFEVFDCVSDLIAEYCR